MKRKKKRTKKEGAKLVYQIMQENFLDQYGDFVSLESQEDLDIHVSYISYRVESELYDLLLESGDLEEMPWDEFVSLLRHWPAALERSHAVARRAFFSTLGDTSFQLFLFKRREHFTERDLSREENDNIPSAQILAEEEGRAMVGALLYRAQVIQYLLLRKEGEDCSWKEYLKKLAGNRILWGQVIRMMHNALANTAFRAAWEAENGVEAME